VSLVYSRSDSGLVVANQAADEASVERALKQLDRQLELQCWPSLDGPPLYKVVARLSDDRPPVTVLVWQTEQAEPLPLSSRLIDEVQRLDRNSRGEYLDDDERNRRLAEQRDRDWERDTEALATDWERTHGQPILHRSVSLRMARDKRRSRGEKV
jgi:hypothetical protein